MNEDGVPMKRLNLKLNKNIHEECQDYDRDQQVRKDVAQKEEHGKIEKEPVSCGRDLQKQRYVPQASERV
jgi:hypothetical protein